MVITDDSIDRGLGYDEDNFLSALQAKYEAMHNQPLLLEDVRFHAIMGIAEKGDDTAYGPGEAVVDTNCSGASAKDSGYEDLAIATGGLRYPVCSFENGAQEIFTAVSQSTISGAGITCTFTAEDEAADYSRAAVLYRPGDGSTVQALPLRADSSECASGGYTQDGATFTLCPVTCDAIEADAQAEVSVFVGCAGPVVE